MSNNEIKSTFSAKPFGEIEFGGPENKSPKLYWNGETTVNGIAYRSVFCCVFDGPMFPELVDLSRVSGSADPTPAAQKFFHDAAHVAFTNLPEGWRAQYAAWVKETRRALLVAQIARLQSELDSL